VDVDPCSIVILICLGVDSLFLFSFLCLIVLNDYCAVLRWYRSVVLEDPCSESVYKIRGRRGLLWPDKRQKCSVGI
jgi:hypothetical protein